MASSSQDCFSLTWFLFGILPFWGVKSALIVVCWWLAVWILQLYWVHLLLFVFFQWRNLQRYWLFLHVTCGLVVDLFVCHWWCYWLQRIAVRSIFLVIVCCVWYTISQLYIFLSLVYAIQLWGCLYLLHALCLDLTVFWWLLMYLLNHSCLGMSEYMIVFSEAVFSSALYISVLSLWHVWSRESLVSRVGAVKLVSNASAVTLLYLWVLAFVQLEIYGDHAVVWYLFMCGGISDLDFTM